MNTTGSTNEMVDNYLQFQPLLLVTPYPDRLGFFSETSCTEELVWNVNHVGEAGPSRYYTTGVLQDRQKLRVSVCLVSPRRIPTPATGFEHPGTNKRVTFSALDLCGLFHGELLHKAYTT